MARRDRTQTPEAPEAPTTEEAAVTAEATEAPAQAEPENKATEKPAETPINLDAFTEAVDAAYGERDESTGVVPEANLAAVTEAYRELDGIKPKNAAKNLVSERLKEAVNTLDIVAGRAYMLISESLTAGAGGTKGEKAPADPTEALTVRILTLDLARNLIPVPEGVDVNKATEKANAQYEELFPKAQSYLAWSQADEASRGDEPEVNATVRAAVKLATGKTAKAGSGRSGGGSSFDGPRRDIGEHIRQAFEDKESGDFMTIAEIRNFKSEEYGDNPPSAGAISARLFPTSGKCSLEFVVPDTNEKGNRGARKA